MEEATSTDGHEDRVPSPAAGRALTPIHAAAPKTIVVNGRTHPFDGNEIRRSELVKLAFPESRNDHGSALTVAYDYGPSSAPSGLIATDSPVRVLDGQTFNVSLTDKS